MQGHPGASRVSSAKDKADFIKEASIRYIASCTQSIADDETEELRLDEDTAKAVVAQCVDLAEMHWDELKRRGLV